MVDLNSYESVERRWWNMVLSDLFSTRESARQYAKNLGVDPFFIEDVLSSPSVQMLFGNPTKINKEF